MNEGQPAKAGEIITPMAPGARDVHGLAQEFQNLAEVSRRQMEETGAAAIEWYLLGAAEAWEMAARRVRETTSPTVRHKPPVDSALFVAVYETLARMLSTVKRSEG